MSRGCISILLLAGMLQSCAGYKQTSVLDRELPNEGTSQYVKFDSNGKFFEPAVAELGNFIPGINVANYKKSSIEVHLECYVSYRMFVGIPDTSENFEIREHFYNKGYVVYWCEEQLVGDKIKYKPKTILASNRHNFGLVCQRRSREFLVLLLEDHSVGRIYKASNIYKSFR